MTADSVGERMRAIFDPPDDVVEPETSARWVLDGRGYRPRPVEPEPPLPPEVGDRLRTLLREGDYPSAAQYAAMALDSLGLPSPRELPTGPQTDRGSDVSADTTDAHDDGDPGETTPSRLPPWPPMAATPTATASDGPEPGEGGHQSH